MQQRLKRDAFETLRIAYPGSGDLRCSISPLGDGVSIDEIDRAESMLQCSFPPSYRLFLELHNGGHIPEELTWILWYNQWPDLVWTTLDGRKTRTVHQPSPTDKEIVVANADGDLICIDTSIVDSRGESPVVWALLGGERIPLANSFLEFVTRRFIEYNKP